jgi:acyl dehydratase
MVDAFADATDDHQWIHVDVERAATGPFGGTIAHGFLTLSLVASLLRDVLTTDHQGFRVNYGVNRVRFPSPVLVGTSLRAAATLAAFDTFEGGAQLTLDVTVSSDGAAKPACVAQCVYRYYNE